MEGMKSEIREMLKGIERLTFWLWLHLYLHPQSGTTLRTSKLSSITSISNRERKVTPTYLDKPEVKVGLLTPTISKGYDLEANLALLKLYQFNPTHSDMKDEKKYRVVRQVLPHKS